MGQPFSRKDLHALVWSEAITKTAASLGVSDVVVARPAPKASFRFHPEVIGRAKPPVSPHSSSISRRVPRGLDDEIQIPGGLATHYYGCSDAEALGPLPPPPTFDEPIEEVRAKVDSLVAPVPIQGVAH